MTKYRCFNTPGHSRDVIKASAAEYKVSAEKTDDGSLVFGSPIGGYFATARMSFAEHGDAGCEISLYVRPRAWLLALIHFVIIGLCGVLFWLISDQPVTNFFFVLIAMAAVGFSVLLLVVGTRCSNRLERIFTIAGKKGLSGLNQESPFAVQMRWYEFVALGFWPMLVVIYISMQWGVTGAIFSQIILVAALYGIPMVQRAQSSYRISQYLLEMNLVIACAVFIAAFTVMASGGSTYSFIENYEGDRRQINATILFNNMIQSEWYRDDVVGLRGEEYAQALAGLMSTKPQAMTMTKVTVAFMAFFAILGFWAMRRSSGLGKSLVQVGRPETPDMPMPPTDEHVGRLVYLTMLVGCVLAGIYRWVYALLCVDVTLAIWFQKSYIFAPIDWLVVFYLEMLKQHSTMWLISGALCLHLIALPGLLMLCKSGIQVIKQIVVGVLAPYWIRKYQVKHSAVDNIVALTDKCGEVPKFSVVAMPCVRQVIVSEYSLLSGKRFVAIDRMGITLMRDDDLESYLLHECYHLKNDVRLWAWLKLMSLLLLSPNYSLLVLVDFNHAEFEADRFACESGDSEALAMAITKSDNIRARILHRHRSARTKGGQMVRRVIASFNWVTPIFQYHINWTASYPQTRERIRRVFAHIDHVDGDLQ